jgi:Icc-related predicted phosphoesterase
MEIKAGTKVFKIDKQSQVLHQGFVLKATRDTEILVAWVPANDDPEFIDREVSLDLYPDAEHAITAHLRRVEANLRRQANKLSK